MSSSDLHASSPSFRQRLAAGELLAGSFIKTPSCHGVEILGGVGYDFVVIDEEHAPFDRSAIDVALLAARASGLAGLVRIARPDEANILSVLDCGATGILVPHVADAAMAQRIAAAARYRGGRRGFSGSPRAGGYGALSIWDHVAQQDEAVTVIAQIEDPEALEHIDAIATTPGIDALFIGRADLAVATGEPSPTSDKIKEICARVAAAADKAGKPVAAFTGSSQDMV